MFLRKLIQCYLQPGYILGIGVFFGNSKAKKQHRKLITEAHPSLPRWQAASIHLLLSLSWYLVVFWLHLATFISEKENIKYLKTSNFNSLNTIKNVLFSGLWLGVSPYNFIALKLTETPRHEWENFIFIEEASTWHTHLNRNDCDDGKFEQDLQVLTNKKKFSEYLLNFNIPAIETIATYDQEEKLPESDIHFLCSSHGGGIFIKPNALNAMLGCFEVTTKETRKNKTDQPIHIWGKTLEGKFIEKTTTEECLSIIHKTQSATDIIIQPLLENHDDLVMHHLVEKSEILITFRIVTKLELQNSDVKILSALLEYPQGKMPDQTWGTEVINIDSGNIESKSDCNIPNWPKIKSYVTSAHKQLESIKTIAWDVCVSNKGVKIIEGNFGWNVIAMQHIHREAILTVLNNGENLNWGSESKK